MQDIYHFVKCMWGRKFVGKRNPRNPQTLISHDKWQFHSEARVSDLHDVQGTELHPSALLRVVDLGAFDDDRVGGEVDPPGQGRGWDQDLDVTVSEQVLHQDTVHSEGQKVKVSYKLSASSYNIILIHGWLGKGSQCQWMIKIYWFVGR